MRSNFYKTTRLSQGTIETTKRFQCTTISSGRMISMNSDARHVPEGYRTVTPYLAVVGAERLLDFLKRAFAAEETERVVRQDGTIGHAEVRVGDSVIMLTEVAGDLLKPTVSSLYMYVEDTDATYQRALDAGATSVMAPVDSYHGDRNAGVEDPFGNQWWIATRFEEVPADELQRRADALNLP